MKIVKIDIVTKIDIVAEPERPRQPALVLGAWMQCEEAKTEAPMGAQLTLITEKN